MKRIILAASVLAVAGPAQAGTVQYTLGGGDTKVYTRSLTRGEYVELTLQSNGKSNLDLFMRGPSRAGWSYCARPADFEGCGFEVLHSGKYSFEVRNRGSRANTFTLDIERR
jgi:hypothetical protein